MGLPTAGKGSSIYSTIGRRVAEVGPSGTWDLPLEDGTDQVDVWDALAERLDPAELRPKLADDVEVREFTHRWGPPYAMIANPRDLVHFRVDGEELDRIRLMDGTRTLKEIVVDRFRDSGDLELSGIADTVRQLEAEGFMDHRVVDVSCAVERALNPAGTIRQKARRLLKDLTIEWSGAEPLVRFLYRRVFAWCLHPAGAALCAIVAVLGFAAFVADVESGRYSMTGRSLGIGMAVLFVLNYLMVFVHELGHALVLTHYRRRVKSVGFMIYFGSPAFFVDASDGLMLDPAKRMLQSFAGPYAQMIIGGLSAVVAYAFPGWFLAETFYRWAVLNYLMLTMNLIPLLELDGYFILSDYLRVPELRAMSFSFTAHELLPRLRERERLTRRELALVLYAVLGVLFTIFSFWTAYFYWRTVFAETIRNLWDAGAPGRTALVVGALVIAGPLVRGLIDLLRSIARRLRALRRRLLFRLERGWRVEAGELLSGVPVFSDLDEDALGDLAGRVRLRTFARGEAAIRQGERAVAFFLVRSGTFQVVEEDRERVTERVLRVLGRGETFGELGLVEAAPRSATVRALEEAEAFEIDKSTFDRILSELVEVPGFAPTVQGAAELRDLSCFSHLQPDELGELLSLGSWVNVPPGEAITTQGEPGDAFFAIGSGRVEVLEDGVRVSTLGPGDWFGEVALLLDTTRTATVRALTPTRTFRVHREGFDRLVARSFRRGTLTSHAAADRLWHH